MELHFLHPGHYHIDLHVHGDGTEKILEKLDLLNTKIEKVMTDLTALTAQVTANSTVIDSAIALIQGIKAQLDAAGTDAVALKALSDSLGAKDQQLADAITANTPAATT